MNKTFTKLKGSILAAMLAFGFAEAASAQTLLSESFTATGIPTGWTNTPIIGATGFIRETDGSSNGSFPGTFTGTTASTGYALYDSDNNANAAGDSVVLKTPVINATGKSVVFLKFNEYYAEYNSTAYVQVSTNNTTWTRVHTTDAGLANNAATPNPRLVNVDISSVAANQATVYVRFVYASNAAGGAYWWFLDDVEVYSPATGASDLAVKQIYSLGKLPLSANATPHVVKAIIKNEGTNLVASETVTLTVGGANTFTTTATVTNLAAGASKEVTFTGYTPTTAGANTVTVTVPSDVNNANNSGTYDQVVTASTISYAIGNPPTATNSYGFTNGNAAFYVKYKNNSTTASSITTVRALIGVPPSTNNATVGKSLYAVVLDANGAVIATSSNVTITAAQIGTLVDFPTGTTIIPANSDFYVGLVQPTGGFFPMAVQTEDPARTGTYFTGGVNGGTLTQFTVTTARLVIEAEITAAPTTFTDASVEQLYSLGKVALTPGGNAAPIQARIKNNGTTVLTNLVVTAAVSNSSYSQTVTIPTLAVGATTTVNFPDFVPATAGAKTITVSVAADGNTNNNSKTSAITVTTNTLSYAIGTTASSYVGFTATANAAFLIRLKTTGTIKVNTVRAFLFDDVSIEGKTVYAVVVDSLGNLIGRSADVVLTGGDRGSLRPFAITVPPTVTNSVYYVGLAQPTYTGAQYFPLGFQTETPQRSKAFYSWGLAAATPTKPVETIAGRRYIIEADVTNVTAVKEELNSNLVSVYPNPSNGVFNVSAKDMKGNNVAFEVRDMQGKLVYSASATKDNTTLTLKNIASGVYMLKVSTDAQVAVKRLVIE